MGSIGSIGGNPGAPHIAHDRRGRGTFALFLSSRFNSLHLILITTVMLITHLASVVLPILAFGSLAEATPTDLLGRNNDKGSGGYKSKCQAFKVSGIDSVVQNEGSIYYPAGAKINITGLQSSLVASDLPSFCSESSETHFCQFASLTLSLLFILCRLQPRLLRYVQGSSSKSTLTLRCRNSMQIRKSGSQMITMGGLVALAMVGLQAELIIKPSVTMLCIRALLVGANF